MLRIEFSSDIWEVYRKTVLIQGAAQLEFYFLQMHSAHQEMNSTEEALSYWMKTRLDQSHTFLGCTESLMRNINELNPKSDILLFLSHPSIVMSHAGKETPLPVPAVAWGRLCFPKGKWSKCTHPWHI